MPRSEVARRSAEGARRSLGSRPAGGAAAVRAAARAALGELARALPPRKGSVQEADRALKIAVMRAAFVAAAEARGLGRAPGGGGARARLGRVPIGPSEQLDALDDAILERIVAMLRGVVAREGAEPELLGAAFEGLTGVHLERVERGRTASFAIVSDPGRRRAGAYFTPRALCETAVERALAPLVERASSADDVLALRVCDPAMGCGAFLLEVCRVLAAACSVAPRAIARSCLFGVDRDPLAVDVARAALWLLVASPDDDGLDVDFPGLVCGDSLVGARPADLASLPKTVASGGGGSPLLARVTRETLDVWTGLWFWPEGGASQHPSAAEIRRWMEAPGSKDLPRWVGEALAIARAKRAFHWEIELPQVFGRDPPGFDAVVGNPPWIAYAGRAAQPLDRASYAWLSRSPAFGGYRTLHGVFVHRCAELLRPGGRLGLVVPTSLSDLAGYAPARRAHDALCEAEPDLDDFGAHAFDDVFQPAMALVSTRRQRPRAAPDAQWSLARSDLDPVGRALLERIAALPPVDPSLFGERGFQSLSSDTPHLVKSDRPLGRHTTPIREGADIGELRLLPPRHHIDPVAVGRRLRDAAAWHEVAVLVRQTARWPIAAPSDGIAFRNSILAGFAVDGWTDVALAAFLNSTFVRWLHFARFRDARQGMPQVKISHLRALPDPKPRRDALVRELAEVASRAFQARAGLAASERAAIDEAVARAFELTAGERACIERWARSVRG